MLTNSKWGATIGALLLCACTPYRHLYAPTVPPSAAGWPSTHQAVPPEIPRGDIETSSLGLVDLSAAEGAVASRAIRVHIVVRNRDDTKPWRLDAAQQVAHLPGEAAESPVRVAQSSIEIPPGAAQTLDLYYAVPHGVESTTDLPGFEFDWAITTADRVVTGSVPIVRLIAVPAANPEWQFPLPTPPGWGRW